MDITAQHVRRVQKWIEALSGASRRFAIVYHGDCDGAVSGALFDFIFRNVVDRPDIHHIAVRTEQYDFAQALAALESIRPDATVFLDLSIQNHPDKLKRASDATGKAVLVYDHHNQTNDTVPENTLYLNSSVTPQGHDEDSAPPCYFSAQLAERLIGTDYNWAAAIGLIGESAVERFMPLFRKLSGQFPELCPTGGITTPTHVQKSRFREISYAIGSAYWGPEGEYEQTAFDVLSGMIADYSPQSFFADDNLDARKIIDLEGKVRRAISRTFVETVANMYYDHRSALRYAEVSSEYRIGGVVATRMSHKYRDDLIVTGQDYHGRYIIEARRGSRRSDNMAALLERVTRDLDPFSTGGHPAAAGATLPPASAPEFFLALETVVRGT